MNSRWSAKQAYSRNLGLITAEEQAVLGNALVAIPGCGGIGSTVAETLARLGVGKFRLCDPDSFDIANINRQLGAISATFGLNKAESTKARIESINPTAVVDIVEQPISTENADAFVFGCSAVLDGIDFYAVSARRALFSAAKTAHIPAMTAAPLGFSATLHVFLPDQGMSFDQYFDFQSDDSYADQLIKFWVGLAPKGLHRPYMDLSVASAEKQTGPSSIIGTQLAAVMIAGELIRLLLKREPSEPAPVFRQVDAYRQLMVKRRIPMGNRHPLQRLKIVLARRAFKQIGLWQSMNAAEALGA